MKRIQRFALLICCLLAVTGMRALADEISWSISESRQSLTACEGAAGEVVVPDTVDGVQIRMLDSYLFGANKEITGIVVPEGVKSLLWTCFFECTSLTSVELPDTLQVIGKGVFEHCEALESIVIPASVGYLGDDVFNYCYGLRTVEFKGRAPYVYGADDLFYACDVLEQIIVPDDCIDAYSELFGDVAQVVGSGENAAYERAESTDFTFDASTGTILSYTGEDYLVEIPAAIDGTPVTAIGEEAFFENSRLLYISVPEGVTYIGKRAFGEAEWVSSYVLPSTLEEIDDGAFTNAGFHFGDVELTLPDGLHRIGAEAFLGLRINALTIPEGVEEIADRTFYGASIDDVYLPSTLQKIGSEAFYDCLTQYMCFAGYELPQIGEHAFGGRILEWLADIDLPWDVSRDVWEAFKSAFEPMEFNGLTIWRNNPVSGGVCSQATLEDGQYTDGYLVSYSGSLENISVYTAVDDVNTIGIGEGVFAGNTHIRSFYPHHCEWFSSIGAEAFADSTLEYIEMFDSITTIGAGAFRNCTSLTEIVLPAYLTEVGEEIFAGCTSLEYVDIQCDPSILPAGLFKDCSALTGVNIAQGSIPADFLSGTSVTEVTLGENVEDIGENAFAGTGITGIVLPEGTTVAAGAVDGIADVRAAENASEEYIEYLTEALGHAWYEPVLRVGEEAGANLIAMPFAPTDESAFTFDASTGTITAYNGTDPDVVIPREIGGVTVVNIDNEAFSACRDYTDSFVTSDQTGWVILRSLVIPETVRSLGEGSFYCLQQLETFICYAPLETTGGGAFRQCRALKDVIFVNGVRTLGNYCFEETDSLEHVYCGGQLREISQYAFNFSGIGSFAADVRTIGQGAFTVCENLKELHIGSSIESMEYACVSNCQALERLCLETANADVLPGDGIVNECGASLTVQLPEGADELLSQRIGMWGSSTEIEVTYGTCTREAEEMPDVEALYAETRERELPDPFPEVEVLTEAAVTAQPVGEAGEPYIGTWSGYSMIMDGEEMLFSDYGYEMTITLQADGTVLIYDGEETDQSVWSVTGSGILLEGQTGRLEGEELILEEEGVSMHFVRH